MIDAIPDVGELDKIWRQTILEQSELSSDRVLNSMSIRGVDLVRRFGDTMMSINIKDCFIVFHISFKQTDNDISLAEEDDSITKYQAYSILLTIYGDGCMELASMLKARLETDRCRTDLFKQAVYFEKISSLTETNEFLNETAWHRADIEIDFSIREQVTQIHSYDDYESLGELLVYD